LHEYNLSLYWSFQTITTVGYGDIALENNKERLICSAVMVAGVILFTMANATIISIAEDLDESGDYKEKYEALLIVSK